MYMYTYIVILVQSLWMLLIPGTTLMLMLIQTDLFILTIDLHALVLYNHVITGNKAQVQRNSIIHTAMHTFEC